MRYWCLKNYSFYQKNICVEIFMKYKWNIYGIKLKINYIKFVV